jgi:RNA ligase (TIGR02306 family)
MAERKLASIRRIDNITPIEGADFIHLLHFGGWKVVTQKEMGYQIGDRVVYCEIDSFIPHDIAPFLTRHDESPMEYDGVIGQRLRTRKFKGQYSQGLVLPLKILEERGSMTDCLDEGYDVSEILGILKWERPSEFLGADTKGEFPAWIIPKTDQERIQNIANLFEVYKEIGTKFQVTEKLDGGSITIYKNEGQIGVCARNVELVDNGGTYWKTARELGFVEWLELYPGNLAFQGELIGPGIESNHYKLKKHEIRIYNIFNIDTQEYLPPETVYSLCVTHGFRKDHVPVVESEYTIPQDMDIETFIKQADGISSLNPKVAREGLVFKHLNGRGSFKVVSNKWLGKNE